MANFSVLSWNLAQGGPSINAPQTVDRESNLFAMLDEVETHNPDFICFQEMPSAGFVHYLSDTYVAGQPVKAHSGYTSVLVRKATIADQPIQLENQLNLPPATGVSLQIGDNYLVIFSIHLFPSKKNSDARYQFFSGLYSQLSHNHPMIFAGDYNMREAETQSFIDLGVFDAYKQIDDGDRSKYATWDSTINQYNHNSFTFRARFDRIFYRNLTLQSFQLIGNEPQSSPPYYFSDHFGLLAEFSLE